ncbi:SGNH/GDSL hydrolase family protein [Streptomyces abyssomicinicus]|uniref:SGNH/GDSL hydrolase family protein n=1 Tax=Streptomyces abyssomicinicus TaxID=574929 RepID=UPI00124F7955|nr:SGNH/GDSL hydrolase family protein [Streptomyces abyssomicinicus]
MPRRLLGHLAVLVTGLAMLLAAQPASADTTRPAAAWTGTWAAAPSAVPASSTLTFGDQTLRQVVRTSAAGRGVRVRLTNEFGATPLVIGEARAALAAPGEPGGIRPGTDRPLRFGGRTTVTLPPGARRWSDPVALDIPAGADLTVSMYLPRRTPATTVHNLAYQHGWLAPGNVTGEPAVEPTATVTSWYFLSGVSVGGGPRPGWSGAVVAFGDSITDGAETTLDANRRWPDRLAERLRTGPAPARLGVLNAGISGNRLLRDPNPPAGTPAEDYAAFFGEAGLKRFERDVVDQPGVAYVVVLLGVNDIGQPGGGAAPADEEVTAAEVVWGHRKLVAMAHRHGLKAYGATIMPFEGDDLGFHTPEREARRQAVNAWIRTGGVYDAVVDFDAATRDPAHPARLLPAYDSGDGLHPNDAGMKAMADAVPLRLFR